jgi:hypothetical protein
MFYVLYPFVTYLLTLPRIINVTAESEYWELNNFYIPLNLYIDEQILTWTL